MGEILIKDDKIYLTFLAYKNNKIGDILLDFDFDNKKIINFSYLERN